MADSPAIARVVVHAGYHKTGTTSLQDFLQTNRAALTPFLCFYGKADFRGAGAAARIYSQRPFPWRLWRFRMALRRFLAGVEPGTIVLSRETFSGGMPGHRRLGGRLMMSYIKAARPLAQVIVAELRRRFGTDTEIIFFYTLRERESWIRSVYGHLLRSIRLTQDFETFRAAFPDLPGTAAEAHAMTESLAPVPVVTAALQDYADNPEGPAAALLDLLDVPADVRQTLRPAPRSNPADPAELRAAFLELNRSSLRKGALRAEKERLLREANARGSTKAVSRHSADARPGGRG